KFFKLNDYLELSLPRESANVINIVLEEATVPVKEIGVGNCHVYIDESANEQMSIDIVKNAKLQRPSVCNAIETILIHPESYKAFGEKLVNELIDEEVIIHANESIHSDVKQSEL